MSRPSAADDSELKETNRRHNDPGAAVNANSLLALTAAPGQHVHGCYNHSCRILVTFNIQFTDFNFTDWSFSLGESVSFLFIHV